MDGLDSLTTMTEQVMLLPDIYLRQGITILQAAIHMARMEEEARREQAMLFREALEASGAPIPEPVALTAAGEPLPRQTQQPLPRQNQPWGQDFRAGDPDRQEIKASQASTLITAFEAIIDKLVFTNVTERQLVVEVRGAIDRVRAMGNHESAGEESAGGA